MQFAANLTPPRKLDVRRVRATPFNRADGTAAEVHHPLTKAALLHLARVYPRSLGIPELAASAAADLRSAGAGALAAETGDLVSELFSLVVLGAVDLLHRPRAGGPLGTGPVVPTALARAQLECEGARLATRMHTLLGIDPFSRRLLGHLDGRRGVDGLVECLLGDMEEGRLVLEGVGRAAAGIGRARELVKGNVERLLDTFGRAGVVQPSI
jgi:hypothetical protein